MNIQKLMVVGAGQMGAGIAQVAAAAGVEVLLNDLQKERIAQSIESIKKNLARDVEKGRRTAEDAERIAARITWSTSLFNASDVDLAIEAATEKLEIKATIFRQLDQICKPAAILASNTSSIPITELAGHTCRPDRVIGMHFMNPVPVMKLVEVIRGLTTSDEVSQTIQALAVRFGKVPCEVNDYPGFVSNRVLMPMINEAIFCIYEGVAAPQSVDTVMKLGMRHPMGPLELADLIGLDTCLSILEVLHTRFGDPKYRPCPLLRSYVAAGWLGKKSGRGFYVY